MQEGARIVPVIGSHFSGEKGGKKKTSTTARVRRKNSFTRGEHVLSISERGGEEKCSTSYVPMKKTEVL